MNICELAYILRFLAAFSAGAFLTFAVFLGLVVVADFLWKRVEERKRRQA